MKIIKVFNNNSVSVILPGGREAILLGSGIGFHKRAGETVDENRVDKVYYVQTEMQTKFLEMLQDVQPTVMESAERIIALAEAEGFPMSSQATISLVDHISFAIERQEKHMSLPNLLLSETRLLYQKEFALGQQGLEIIRQTCGVSLPEDEAGYIALHLVSISVDSTAAYGTLKFVKAKQKHCHCEPVTDVTGVAISIIQRYTASNSMEIPTPVCALARNDSFLLCSFTLVRQPLLSLLSGIPEAFPGHPPVNHRSRCQTRFS